MALPLQYDNGQNAKPRLIQVLRCPSPHFERGLNAGVYFEPRRTDPPTAHTERYHKHSQDKLSA